MKTNKKLYVKRVIYTALVLMCVCFIFSQSALSAGESSQESGRILRLLNNIARWFGCENLFTDFFVRKLAHFSEFAVLSFFSFCMYKQYVGKLRSQALFTTLTFVFVAVADECIQLFSYGRACRFADVLIDSAGGVCALLFISIFYIVRNKRGC